jgi:hypothetical protein
MLLWRLTELYAAEVSAAMRSAAAGLLEHIITLGNDACQRRRGASLSMAPLPQLGQGRSIATCQDIARHGIKKDSLWGGREARSRR